MARLELVGQVREKLGHEAMSSWLAVCERLVGLQGLLISVTDAGDCFHFSDLAELTSV